MDMAYNAKRAQVEGELRKRFESKLEAYIEEQIKEQIASEVPKWEEDWWDHFASDLRDEIDAAMEEWVDAQQGPS